MTNERSRIRDLVGKAAAKLEKHRGIVTVGDLLDFAPRRYRTTKADLGSPEVGEYLVAVATVESASTRTMKSRRGKMLEAVITDGRSRMDVTFFSAYGHEKVLQAGRTLLFAGRVGEYRGRRQLAHPAYSTLESIESLGDLAIGEGGLIPVYRHVPGVQSWGVSAAVRVVLGHLDEVLDGDRPRSNDRLGDRKLTCPRPVLALESRGPTAGHHPSPPNMSNSQESYLRDDRMLFSSAEIGG